MGHRCQTTTYTDGTFTTNCTDCDDISPPTNRRPLHEVRKGFTHPVLPISRPLDLKPKTHQYEIYGRQ